MSAQPENLAHSERPHSKYGMSVLHRYMACPGSVALCDLVGPEKPSEYAQEGTRAHELLEKCLSALSLHGQWEGYALSDGERALIPEDMVSAVNVCLQYVTEIVHAHPDAILIVEQPFEIASRAAPDQVWGINDICIYVPSLRALYVIDYKHGAGVLVQTHGNVQVRGYGVGALEAHPEWDVEFVCLVIIQPRVNGFSIDDCEEWVSVEEIRAFGHQIDDAIAATLSGDAPLVPGDKQCRFCSAKTICPAKHQQLIALTGEAFSDVGQIASATLPQPKTMELDELARVLSAVDQVTDFINAVKTEAFNRAQNGQRIPGYKVVESAPRRVYTVPGTAEFNLEDPAQYNKLLSGLAACTNGKLAVKHFVEVDIVGITKAETMIKTAVAEGLDRAAAKAAREKALGKFAFLTTKKSSGTLSLVRDDDPRPAKQVATEAFGDVGQLPYIDSFIGEQKHGTDEG